MLEKTITICGKDVKFRSSATIPRLYRIKFKRDITFPAWATLPSARH